MKTDKKNRKKRKILNTFIVIFFFLCFFILTGCGVSAGIVYGFFKKYSTDLPNINKMGKFDPPQVTEVYADDGSLLGRFFTEKRILVPFEKLPKNYINAIITAEDNQFYEHQGINIRGIFRG